MKDPDLWQRLKQSPVRLGVELKDAETELPQKFTCNKSEAEGLVFEYRKFLYLVAIAGEVLAPSKIVDQLWHMHLYNSHEYDRFCETVIRQKIKHSEGRPPPTRDPAYLRTLELMQHEFGSINRDYWPKPPLIPDRNDVKITIGLAMIAAIYAVGTTMTSMEKGNIILLAILIPFVCYEVYKSSTPRLKRSSRDGGCGGTGGDYDSGAGCGGDGGGCGGGGD